MRFLLVFLASWMFVASAAADCVSRSRIRDYRVDRDALILFAGSQSYVADVGICSQLNWAYGIGFETFSSAWVCDGDYVITYDSTGRATDRCPIWSLEKAL